MSRELNDAEYAAMLAGGNASIAMHDLVARKNWGAKDLQQVIEQAVYRAVHQVFSDRLKIELPREMPDLFADDPSDDANGSQP